MKINWWCLFFFSNLSKIGLQEERITLWASTSPSSQAKVTSVKSGSLLNPLNDNLMFSWKSFHFRKTAFPPLIPKLGEHNISWRGWVLALRLQCQYFTGSEIGQRLNALHNTLVHCNALLNPLFCNAMHETALGCIAQNCLETALDSGCPPLGAGCPLVSRWVGPSARGQAFLVGHCNA